jgi:c-di-GMP-binding flagellar brake protein YcgR
MQGKNEGSSAEVVGKSMSAESRFCFERRKQPRFHGSLPVEYQRADVPQIRTGHTVNISEGGMMILVSEPLEAGEHLEMKLYFSSPRGLITVRATVREVWADKEENEDGYFRLGVNFVCISPDNMANLKLLLALHGG